ncbi:Flp1 family type IVb pilin [uncultured Gemmiger sp.]|uniref:Flp1 family type IVb pilin n=1 Tax=uncultured Gemmiger sp. TaxID=1623490 RepID=UPI0025DD6E7B|nr:Flp1 family type IVb pilin [uncultured Gemmiger sp.]
MDKLCMMFFAMMMQAKQNFLEEERGAVDIVAIVVLIGIAVLLAVLFKDQVTGLLNSLFETINKNATNAVN